MKPTTPSWQSMYADEKYRWFWPPAFDPDYAVPELPSVLAMLDMQPDARILDLACGLGWLTIPLALRGFRVTGLDLSEALLARAGRAAEQAAFCWTSLPTGMVWSSRMRPSTVWQGTDSSRKRPAVWTF